MRTVILALLLSACGDNVPACDPADRRCGQPDANPANEGLVCPRLYAGVVFCEDVSRECLEFAHGPQHYGLTCPEVGGLSDAPCFCETAAGVTWCQR
jgi:hypothetical protein